MNLLVRLLQEQENMNSSTISPSSPLIDEKKCDLFGGFSFMVQLILGVLSFMVLVIKRYREIPRRPWKIWFLDVSKQLISSASIHSMNLFIAIFLSVDKDSNTKTDECMWYFMNLFVDTTLGIFICYALMRLIENLAKEHSIKDLQSGLYYEKYVRNGKTRYRLKPKMFLIQLIVWTLIVVTSKCFLLGFTKIFSFYINIIGNFILKPFIVNDKIELIMVMVVFPLILNSVQFWIFDNILKLPPEGIKELNENENIIDGFDINQLNILNELQLRPIEPEANLENDNIKSQYVPPTPQINMQIKTSNERINENDITRNTAIFDCNNVSVNGSNNSFSEKQINYSDLEKPQIIENSKEGNKTELNDVKIGNSLVDEDLYPKFKDISDIEDRKDIK